MCLSCCSFIACCVAMFQYYRWCFSIISPCIYSAFSNNPSISYCICHVLYMYVCVGWVYVAVCWKINKLVTLTSINIVYTSTRIYTLSHTDTYTLDTIIQYNYYITILYRSFIILYSASIVRVASIACFLIYTHIHIC